MKSRFPIRVTRGGVTVKIHQAKQIQNGKTYDGYLVVYSLFGKRKRVWRSDLPQAQLVAKEACLKISNGEQLSLTLNNGDLRTK